MENRDKVVGQRNSFLQRKATGKLRKQPLIRRAELLMRLFLCVSPGKPEHLVADAQSFGVGSNFNNRTGGSVAEALGMCHLDISVLERDISFEVRTGVDVRAGHRRSDAGPTASKPSTRRARELNRPPALPLVLGEHPKVS
jgi:hypothetical protein